MPDKWRVLLPKAINSVGPKSIADIATTTGIHEYDTVDDALNDIERYDAIMVRVAELNTAVLDRADRLKVISKHGAGLNNVDVDAASERDIVVCNTPGANARSVAEHAMALLFGVRRNLRTADAHVREGGWDRAAFGGHELTSDRLGLFGFGDIAREMADLALGIGQEVMTFDPYVPNTTLPEAVMYVEEPLTLFDQADAVSVHVPLTEETRHAISVDELRALGSNGVLVNTSRGTVVDERSLVEALGNGDLGGAGLDVFETEPPGDEHPLYDHDEVLLTPHVGGVTDAAMERMSRQAAANIRTVYEGRLPDSTVNQGALDREVAR